MEPSSDLSRLDNEALINALASTNEPPELVGTGNGRFPLFPTTYDFTQSRPIYRTLKELAAREGNELWPLLVKYSDDKRYSYTYDADGWATNGTVGDFCIRMAYNDLVGWLGRRTSKANKTGEDPPRPKSPKQIKEWYASRSDMQLWELQIKLGESVLSEDPDGKDLMPRYPDAPPPTDEERLMYVKNIRTYLDEIRTTHKPIVNHNRFDGEYFSAYDASSAQRFRENYGHLSKTNKPSNK